MKINKCKKCNCDCSLKEHSDLYGVCSCADCKCDQSVVVDSNEDCEGASKRSEWLIFL